MKRKKTYFDHHYKKSKAILESNGENLDRLLISFKRRLEWARKKKTIKKNINFGIRVNSEVFFRFKMTTMAEDITSKALLEAFMNYFVEGDDDLPALLDKLSFYNKKSIYLSSKNKKDKIALINKLNNIYNIPNEWWIKYTDLNNEEFDF